MRLLEVLVVSLVAFGVLTLIRAAAESRAWRASPPAIFARSRREQLLASELDCGCVGAPA